jgi:lysophospholipid acyltransferase (LPLAT)-like uncharacterized protein
MSHVLHKWMKRSRRKLGSLLMPRVAPFVFRRLARSWRVELIDEEYRAAVGDAPGCLWTLWHGRMILGLAEHEGVGYTVLVSPSKDGDLMDTLLPKFGLRVIRGSSSRTGARSLREMLRSLKQGGTVVVTPDGPRGPRHSGSAGVVWLARATGFPVLPCGFVASPAWRLRSWDAFTIPKWRSRVKLVFGEPLHVPRDADDVALKAANDELLRRMLDAEARGFAALGIQPDWPAEDLARWEAGYGETPVS